MEFLSLTNKKRKVKGLAKYYIDWDGESRSKFQFNVKKYLKRYWFNNVVFEEFPIVGTRLTLDFYNMNKKIAVEVQGRQHQKFIPYFHGNLFNFKYQLDRDRQKELFCEKNKIILVTIFDTDVVDAKLFESQGIFL